MNVYWDSELGMTRWGSVVRGDNFVFDLTEESVWIKISDDVAMQIDGKGYRTRIEDSIMVYKVQILEVKIKRVV